MAFYVLQHVWYIQNNSVEAPFNILATSRSRVNICCFNQDYDPGEITFEFLVLIFKYLVAVSFG